jgi:RNase P protein component
MSSKALLQAILTTGKKSRNKYFSVFGDERKKIGFYLSARAPKCGASADKLGGCVKRVMIKYLK